jgi:hypothetical protein
MKKEIVLHVSPELHALASGYAGFYGKSIEDYVIEGLLTLVQADAEANLDKELPETKESPAGISTPKGKGDEIPASKTHQPRTKDR